MSKSAVKIVDAFIFYNELAMLEYRLNQLSDHVDNFIIVEARQTFTGRSKELIYLQNASRFAKWADQIVHIVVDLPHGSDAWANERVQRDAISHGVSRLGLCDTDIVIVSDVDEIPDYKTVAHVVAMGIPGFVALSQDLYYYNIETRYNASWSLARISTVAAAVSIGGYHALRNAPTHILIAEGGWHLSYFGDVQFIKNKIESFSHQDLNTPEFTNATNIQERVSQGIDLFGRQSVTFTHVPKAENPYLPPAIKLLEELLKTQFSDY